MTTTRTLQEQHEYNIGGLGTLGAMAAVNGSRAQLAAVTELTLAYFDFVDNVNEQLGTTLDTGPAEGRAQLQAKVDAFAEEAEARVRQELADNPNGTFAQLVDAIGVDVSEVFGDSAVNL